MERVYCCCSAGRSALIVKKTLKTLTTLGFNRLLWLIVPSEEVETYQAATKDHPIHMNILGAHKGLVKQRKYFRLIMPPGTQIVFIDDDIEAIKTLTTEGTLVPANLEAVTNYIFKTMLERGSLLAGVYPVANRSWQNFKIVQPAFVVGAFYCIINDDRLLEPEEIDTCEDWARCLGEIDSGRPVLRFNFCGIQTKYFNTDSGGIPDQGRSQRHLTGTSRLAERYPYLVKQVIKRNGKPDLKLLPGIANSWIADPSSIV